MRSDGGDDRKVARLLDRITRDAAETAAWTGRASFSAATMRALARVPREAFVDPGDRALAYENRPLGIGFGQTISQPFIVALMTDLLDLRPLDRVLEIGTGSGYQTAVLAGLATRVLTVETLPELSETALRRLHALGIRNVEGRCADGFAGWPEEAPFDAIVVTAAPPEIPRTLMDQLRPGGRLVVPVGPAGETQMLLRCVRSPNGSVETRRILPVAFVPMIPRRSDGEEFPS